VARQSADIGLMPSTLVAAFTSTTLTAAVLPIASPVALHFLS
jgi:hypothetical protein